MGGRLLRTVKQKTCARTNQQTKPGWISLFLRETPATIAPAAKRDGGTSAIVAGSHRATRRGRRRQTWPPATMAAVARRDGGAIVAGGHGDGGGRATWRGRRHRTWPPGTMAAVARRDGGVIVAGGHGGSSRVTRRGWKHEKLHDELERIKPRSEPSRGLHDGC
uniref:Uncharacterized protein n=1 Tax=Oryza punctata TaxID=4537 RepID=A0A0E0KHY0_ORYPU